MALKLALNTTGNPGLAQVTIWTQEGLFDFKAQQVSGSVDMAKRLPQFKRLMRRTHPVTDQPLFVEA